MHHLLSAEQALVELRYVVQSIKFIPVWENNQPGSYSLSPAGFTDAVVANVCALSLAVYYSVVCLKRNAVFCRQFKSTLDLKYKL